MVNKNLRKVISMVLVLLMTCSSMVFAAGGDYTGHWAEESIQNWVDKGYVRGYADGSFKPENDITRAEFISIVNRSFGFTEEKAVAYKDVKASHWAYNEFKRADAAGYIGGFEDGTLRPNAKITRQEVASIIGRLLNLNPAKDSDAFLNLADVEAIPEWSVGVVSAMVDKGYMKLRSGNTFAPVSPATRAEVIAALDSSYLTITKVKYDEAGTYTAGVVEGSVEINAKDVILEDTTINGNLIIGEGVGNGDVTLNNVTVKGNTIVKGGGMDSIIIIDSQIKNLIVEKKDGKVRILAKGKTYIQKVEMKSGGKLESSDLKEDNFGDIVIAENLISSEAIILAANFANVEIKSGKNEIKVLSGTIKNLLISKTAKNAKINLAEGVKVDKVEINAVTTIDGKGKIGTAIINVNGVKITASVDKIEKAKDVDKVDTTKPSTGGGGSSSDDDSSTPSKPVTPTEAAISIENVSAINGTVTVTLIVSKSGRIHSDRFTIEQSINDEEATVVTPIEVSGKDNVLTFTIPTVEDTGTWRPVFIYVSLDGVRAEPGIFMIGEPVNKDELIAAIAETVTRVKVSTDGTNILTTEKWTTQGALDLMNDALSEAKKVAANEDATQEEVDAAVTAYKKAKEAYEKAKVDGTKIDPVKIVPKEALIVIDLITTSASITFTSGSSIILTTDGAITFTTDAAISLTTSQSIDLKLDNKVDGRKIAYEFSSDKATPSPGAALTSPKFINSDTKLEIDKDTPQDMHLVLYELNNANEIVSYIKVGMIDN